MCFTSCKNWLICGYPARPTKISFRSRVGRGNRRQKEPSVKTLCTILNHCVWSGRVKCVFLEHINIGDILENISFEIWGQVIVWWIFQITSTSEKMALILIMYICSNIIYKRRYCLIIHSPGIEPTTVVIAFKCRPIELYCHLVAQYKS